MSIGGRKALELQLRGYRLATAEIVYHLPDHPGLLQSFIWQHYDLDPDYPELNRFLDFWVQNIQGRLHSVTVGRQKLIHAGEWRHTPAVLRLH